MHVHASVKTLASGTYTDAQVDADLNEAYSEMISWVVQSTGIWEFRGERSTHDLVLNQNEYILLVPTSFRSTKAEVKYFTDKTAYSKTDRIDDKQVDYAASKMVTSVTEIKAAQSIVYSMIHSSCTQQKTSKILSQVFQSNTHVT